MASLGEGSVEAFLSGIKQLEIKTQNEDMERSERLRENLNNDRNILIPRPRVREDSGLVNSESMKNFNRTISEEYRVDLGDLTYKSAYNYERSTTSGGTSTKGTKLPDEPTHKPKQSHMPNVIKFDDFVSATQYQPQKSRYAKFQITEEKRQEIDQTLNHLMGTSISKIRQNENDDTIPPLTRISKGGRMDWSTQAASKPKLAPPVKLHQADAALSTTSRPVGLQEMERQDNNLKKSPRKFGLSEELERSQTLIKPRAKLDFTQDSIASAHNRRKVPPQVKPKTFMSSVMDHSHSTNQSIPTDSKVKITTKSSWLESAQRKGTITQSAIPTDPKIKIPYSEKSSLDKTFLDLQKKEAEDVSTLREIQEQKLHAPSLPSPKFSQTSIEKEGEVFTPVTLRRVRPSVPSKPSSLSNNDLQTPKLKSAPSINRKVSDEPEALRKSRALKPTVPKRKPSFQVPEALLAKSQLHKAAPLDKLSERKPDAIKKLENLKSAPPPRKVSIQQIEALEKLKKLKKGGAPEVKPKKDRVVSQSSQLLLSSLGQLKKVEKQTPTVPGLNSKVEKSPEPPVVAMEAHKNNLNNLFLRRVQTDLTPSTSPVASLPSVKKAATFDGSTTKETPQLEHITATRARGPKRRAPKHIG